MMFQFNVKQIRWKSNKNMVSNESAAVFHSIQKLMQKKVDSEKLGKA